MSPPENGTCFVIMPFGEKTSVEGDRVNFDRIYDDFIVPTVEAAGLTCERCDRIDEAGHLEDVDRSERGGGVDAGFILRTRGVTTARADAQHGPGRDEGHG